MALLKVSLICLALCAALAYAAPNPGFFGGKHEHHTIHVPYNVHTIHHHHIKKVPVIKEVHVPVYKEIHVPVVKEVHVPVHHHHEHHDHHEDVHHIEHIDLHKGWSSGSGHSGSGWY